jgi:S1-C subfamily serine protease
MGMKMKNNKTISAMVVMTFTLTMVSCAKQLATPEPAPEPTPIVQQQSVEEIEPTTDIPVAGDLALAIKKVIPAVVGIHTIYKEANEEVEGLGSGVVVHPLGYVLTNDHVAGGSPSQLTVVFHDGTAVAGQTLWSDPVMDLAIVKLEMENVPSAELGNSDELMVGQSVAAVGTPLSMQFQHTVTAGIISALNRTINVPSERGENFMEDLIQTDASINPGNSGGPLIDYNGRVIGINTVKVTSAEGIGFAIPSEVVKPIVQQFLEYGSFETPYIGLVGYDKEIACYYQQCDQIEDGVYVDSVESNGPAYQAGIRDGDILLAVNDEPITKMWELRKALYSNRVGDSITVKFMHGDEEKQTSIQLIKREE